MRVDPTENPSSRVSEGISESKMPERPASRASVPEPDQHSFLRKVASHLETTVIIGGGTKLALGKLSALGVGALAGSIAAVAAVPFAAAVAITKSETGKNAAKLTHEQQKLASSTIFDSLGPL